MRRPPTADWVKVGRRLAESPVVSTGCCGMAGLYGHEHANRRRSEAIYRLSWATLVTRAIPAASSPQAIRAALRRR